MLVPWRSLNGRHKDTAMCRSGADKKRRRDTEEEIRESAERAFEAYGGQLESVSRFTYLGRVMTAGDDDWPAVAGNLKKARRSWGRLSRILEREGAPAPGCSFLRGRRNDSVDRPLLAPVGFHDPSGTF